MGNKHNSSKKHKPKFLFDSTPEKSFTSSNNKSDIFSKNPKSLIIDDSKTKIELNNSKIKIDLDYPKTKIVTHSEMNLATFRESFKRKKTPQKHVKRKKKIALRKYSLFLI